MKITRHTAKDMRQALRLVRDQLGADAVILTSKRTPSGVEVTAAVDFDAARIEAQAPAAEPRTFRPEEFAPPAPPAAPEQGPRTLQAGTSAAQPKAPAPRPELHRNQPQPSLQHQTASAWT